MATITLVPDGDLAIPWSIPASGTHFDDIDEGVGGPDANFIQAVQASGDHGDQEIFNLTTDTIQGEVSAVTLHVYGSVNDNTNAILYARLGTGGIDWTSNPDVQLTTTPSWKTVTWADLSALEWIQADIDIMRLQFGASLLVKDNLITVWTAYVVFTYTSVYSASNPLGVTSTSVASVMGVLKANIASIKGV